MDAVLLELQIQIGVGEAAGAPMLAGDDLARLEREFGTDLAAPCAVFETLSQPCRPLDGRDVLPGFADGIDDASRRTPETPPVARRSGPPAYEERSCSPPRPPECEARACRPRR